MAKSGRVSRLTFVFGFIALAYWQSVSGHALIKFPYHRQMDNWRQFSCAPENNFHPMYNQELDPALENCGVCGNLPSETPPRSNERGGMYYRRFPGVKAAYNQGEWGLVRIVVIDSHGGYIELRICHDSNQELVNKDCFNAHLLEIYCEDGEDWIAEGTKIFITSHSRYFTIDVWIKVPDFTCEECVMQMHYRAGRSRFDTYHCITGDKSEDGLCRQQETFRDCADLKILPRNTGIELLTNGLNTCMTQPARAFPGVKVRMTTCNPSNAYHMQRVSGLPKWNGNEGHNPFVIVFASTSLCLQANSALPSEAFGTVTLEECTFAKNQNFITTVDESTNMFKIKSRRVRTQELCLSHRGQCVTQEECDDSQPAQFWNLQTQNLAYIET